MAFCDKCGHEVMANEKFCANCGAEQIGHAGEAGEQPPGEKGFFSALFDFRLSEFITPKIIRVLFIVLVILYGLLSLGILFSFFGFTDYIGPIAVVLGLIVSPLVFLLSVIFIRMYMELMIVLFNVSFDLKEVRAGLERKENR